MPDGLGQHSIGSVETADARVGDLRRDHVGGLPVRLQRREPGRRNRRGARQWPDVPWPRLGIGKNRVPAQDDEGNAVSATIGRRRRQAGQEGYEKLKSEYRKSFKDE